MALTTKQQAFVEHYLVSWNASEAARLAGYKDPQQAGYENKTKQDIQEAIQQRLADLKMSADEVLTRLSTHARGSIAPFMRRSPDGELHGFDLGDDKPLDLLHKVSITKRTTKDVTEEKITLELYDAQAALVHIGKHHGLFVDRSKIEHEGGLTIKVEYEDPYAQITPATPESA